jgi:invasion protein IalB
MGKRAIVFVIAALAQFSAAEAQTSAKSRDRANAGSERSADLTTATYGDWQLRCRNVPGNEEAKRKPIRLCEVIQSVILRGGSGPFAQLAFGKPAPGQPLMFTTVLPVNITFPSTVRIAVDEKDQQPAELAWTRCLPGGCFASIQANEQFLKKWRAQEAAGRFTFTSGAGQDVTLPFSFRGLDRALEALAKEG